MNPFESFPNDQATLMTATGRVYGMVTGIVSDNKDPDGLGRVKLRLPWLVEEDESDWAPIATLMAGSERGSFFLPEVDDEVLLAFIHGDLRYPVVLGALWNGQDKPPESNADGENNKRLFKSRSGHLIRFDDTADAEKIEIIDKSEKNFIVIDTNQETVTIKCNKDIVIEAPEGKISLNAKEIEIKASTSGKMETDAGLDLKAGGTLKIEGATVNIN